VWNWFEAVLVLLAITDVALTLLAAVSPHNVSFSLLRLMRVARLTRIMRMLRIKAFKELTLMLKGLLGGLRTLIWATLLLIVAMYIIGVFACLTIGGSQYQYIDADYPSKYFKTVFRAMFTTFRCFLGDCSDESGVSITVKLTDVHGESFMLVYFVCTILVTFGIFNLIVAVYIENTLEAAKHSTEMDRRQRYRESLRIAHATKALVKKFATAARACGDTGEEHSDRAADNTVSVAAEQTVSLALKGEPSDTDDFNLFELIISKDLFLLVIQDPSVQSIMDSLEIPPDRAELFDVLDADASGGLHIQELVMGMLRVRGDARRSDAVATLLTVRSLQSQCSALADKTDKIHTKQDALFGMLQCSGFATPTACASQ